MVKWISKSKLLQPLTEKNFALFWTGQTISILGNAVYNTALPILIIELGGTATEISLASTFFILPQILFLLIGGVITDRFSKKVILFTSDFFCFVIGILVAVLLYFNQFPLLGVYIMSFLIGTAFAFFLPCVNAFIPEIVKKEHLLAANSLRSISSQLSRMIGPLIAAIIFSTVGTLWAFGFNALSFLISSLSILAISITLKPKEKPRKLEFKNYISDIVEGFQILFKFNWLWITSLISMISNIFIASFDIIVLPLLSYEKLDGEIGYSFIRSSFAVGAIIGGIVIGHRKFTIGRGKLYYYSLILTGVTVLAFAMVSNIYLALLCGLFFGFGTTTFVIVWKTLLQDLIPIELIGRVSSIDYFFSSILLPIGYIILGQLTNILGNEMMVIICGSVIIILGIIGLSFRSIRRLN